MERDAFVVAFRDLVAVPALAVGWHWVGKGQTLAYSAEAVDFKLSLIRLGGKRSQPGSIAHVLCGRHAFLRTLLDESVAPGDVLGVNDHPYKFRPSDVMHRPSAMWRYQPENLGHWEHDRLVYQGKPVADVESELRRLAEFLCGPAVSWAETVTPERASAEISRHGEQAWCERLWLEDYAGRRAGGQR